MNKNEVTGEENQMLIRVGEDTAKISLYLKWDNPEVLFPYLKSAREAAQADNAEDSIVELGGCQWQVMPGGIGGKRGMPYMAYWCSDWYTYWGYLWSL
jgi:hypothetical protein